MALTSGLPRYLLGILDGETSGYVEQIFSCGFTYMVGPLHPGFPTVTKVVNFPLLKVRYARSVFYDIIIRPPSLFLLLAWRTLEHIEKPLLNLPSKP